MDFYPGGGSQQPGCLDLGPLSFGFTNLEFGVSCSHSRALQYFQESLHARPGAGKVSHDFIIYVSIYLYASTSFI